MIAKVGKHFEFSAGHRLEGVPKCENPHGHNYKIEVWLKGVVGDDGMVLNFDVLSAKMKPIIDDFDHAWIGLGWDGFSKHYQFSIPSTAENLAFEIWQRLYKANFFDGLVGVVVWETPKAYAEYIGEMAHV